MAHNAIQDFFRYIFEGWIGGFGLFARLGGMQLRGTAAGCHDVDVLFCFSRTLSGAVAAATVGALGIDKGCTLFAFRFDQEQQCT